MYIIQCQDLERFAELCFNFMVKGATFKACAYNLTIELTGGF
jgi:hypothetical protein